jgi:peptidylprolyl isomerase
MVSDGQTARIHYTGTLDDGSVFDSSEDKGPLTVEIGSGRLIPGLESAVKEMDVGETKTVRVGPREAYGDVRDDLIAVVPDERFPDSISREPGTELQVRTEQGGVLAARIVGVSNEGVTIDANHPLAGKDLTFEVSLLEVA